MADRGSCGQAGAGGASRVGKQVQNINRTLCLCYGAGHPIPVDRLLREKTGMLEARGLHPEPEIAIGNGPAFRHGLFKFPLAAPASAPVVDAVDILPDSGWFGPWPYN